MKGGRPKAPTFPEMSYVDAVSIMVCPLTEAELTPFIMDMSPRVSSNGAGLSLCTARKGFFLFPTGVSGETSQHSSKHLAQTLSVCCLPVVRAVSLQGFLNHLVMDHFHAGVRRIHRKLPSCWSNGLV